MTGVSRETAQKLQSAARDMRREPTQAEAVLWQVLRQKHLNGVRFRRQYVVGPYILDFYCIRYRLAIELDGKGHAEPGQQRYDIERTAFLNDKGIMVLRFTNDQVEHDLKTVIGTIFDRMEQTKQR